MQKPRKNMITHLHGSANDLLGHDQQVGRKLVRPHVEGHECAKDLYHRVIVELKRRYDVEMSEEALGDRVSSAAGGTHSGNDDDVHQ